MRKQTFVTVQKFGYDDRIDGLYSCLAGGWLIAQFGQELLSFRDKFVICGR